MNTKIRTHYKLDSESKGFVFKMLAMGETLQSIANEVKSRFDIDLSLPSIHHYKSKYPARIEATRLEIKENINKEIPITNIEIRMYIRQKLLNDLMDNLWVEVPVMDNQGNIKTDKENNPVMKKVAKGNHDSVNKILDSAANEMREVFGDKDNDFERLFSFLKHGAREAKEVAVFGGVLKK